MTPERASKLVVRWVELYTNALPAPIADRRVEEIGADLDDHIAHGRAHRASDRRIALSILSRMARGMPADLSWRRQAGSSKGDSVKPFIAMLVLALGIAALALTLDSPALVLLSILVVVIDIVGMFVLGMKTARRGGFVIPFIVLLGGALGVSALAVTAIVVGERGDAPGMVLLGIVVIVSLIVGAFAFGMRTAQRSS